MFEPQTPDFSRKLSVQPSELNVQNMQFLALRAHAMARAVTINNYTLNKGFDTPPSSATGRHVDRENEFDTHHFDSMLTRLIDNPDSLSVLFTHIRALPGNTLRVRVIFSLNNQGVISRVETGLILPLPDSNAGILPDNDSAGLPVNTDNGVTRDSWQLYTKLAIAIYQDKVRLNGSLIYRPYEGNDATRDHTLAEDLKNISHALDQTNTHLMRHFSR